MYHSKYVQTQTLEQVRELFARRRGELCREARLPDTFDDLADAAVDSLGCAEQRRALERLQSRMISLEEERRRVQREHDQRLDEIRRREAELERDREEATRALLTIGSGGSASDFDFFVAEPIFERRREEAQQRLHRQRLYESAVGEELRRLDEEQILFEGEIKKHRGQTELARAFRLAEDSIGLTAEPRTRRRREIEDAMLSGAFPVPSSESTNGSSSSNGSDDHRQAGDRPTQPR